MSPLLPISAAYVYFSNAWNILKEFLTNILNKIQSWLILLYFIMIVNGTDGSLFVLHYVRNNTWNHLICGWISNLRKKMLNYWYNLIFLSLRHNNYYKSTIWNINMTLGKVSCNQMMSKIFYVGKFYNSWPSF